MSSSEEILAAAERLAAFDLAAERRMSLLLDERSREAEDALRAGTPIRTGATASAWDTDAPDPLTRIVFNAYADRTFVVASGLITGTGERGVATVGWDGAFRLGWPGMPPAPALHDVWTEQATRPLSEGSIELLGD